EIISQDAAGNKSSTVKYSFTIQTEVVPPKAELDASDDSGAKGCEAWYEMEELAVMGIVEVLGRLRRLLHIRADLTRRFTELKP
ncbi:hypothetical protein MJM99_35370, partial [Salmonella enterica subsp. enterica serovar Kentucky]|nr:hypothetical protein [Salmonella enterica subsp. enterica serovar Kentucky]